MKDYFVDLHVHIGRTSAGRRVKYAAANNLTFENIAEECVFRKGIDVVGIIDCSSPGVISDMRALVDRGLARELPDGGILYREKLCIIPGAEIETDEAGEKGSCSGHTINFFPSLKSISEFSTVMKKYIRNINLSSQKAHMPARELQNIVEQFEGVLVPAHAFTPHKSYYGNCTDRLSKIFGEGYERIIAVELGLSADTDLADKISELEGKTFISNSDAHSLPKIAREYNLVTMERPSFDELIKALKREDGRKIKANYGLNPKLGKYHRTFCEKCDEKVPGKMPVTKCDKCGSDDVVVGVLDRIDVIKDKNETEHPAHRPPYIHQVPLEYIPGLGEKTIRKLIERFGSEMDILHYAGREELAEVVKVNIAENIIKAREGKLEIEAGGGGIYGSIKIE